MEPMRPTAFGRYELVGLLAIGGMAEVFLARTRIGGITRGCVIKRVLPAFSADRRFVSMFIDEARITVGLEHENIVRLIDFGQVDGAYFMAIEYVEGIDLVDILRAARTRGEGVPPVAAVWIARSIARGLQAAHLAKDHRGRLLGVVHRDVSPQNVFVAWDGRVKIGDFGIAAARNKLSRTSPGTVMGKYGYMSPEQASGEHIDARTDIWAVGVVLWEMLVGARLFATDSPVDTVARVMGLDVPPPSSLRASVPPALDEICRRALTRSVEDRTATAAVLADQLDACIAGDDGPGALTATLTNYGLESRRGASATRVRGPGAASSSQTSTAQKATDELSRPLPGIADSEVRRLEAVMKKNPSLVVLTDLGERYVELGMANEARSAIRTAAFHFSQRGLLVQAVCALHSLRPLVDDAAFVDDLFRLARLRGASTAQLAEAMQHVEHRVFAEAIAAADVARVVDDGLDATFVPPKAPLLARLPEPDFVKLAGLARVERRQSGVPVVVEGERGDALYAVGRGCVVVHTRRHVVEDVGGGSAAPTGTAPTDPRAYLAALGEGDFFGELSFLTRSARTATVEAISPVVLLRIDRDVVENLATAETAFRVHLLDFYKERVAELVLAKNPILGALPTEARRGIVAVADIRKYRRGDEIVREGDETDELFVVLAGEVEVTRQVQGFPMFINKLNTGDLFGEMALLGGSRRTATVRAMGVVEVLGVRRADVDQILAGDARVRGLLENAMRIRAAETDARVRDTVRIFEGV